MDDNFRLANVLAADFRNNDKINTNGFVSYQELKEKENSQAEGTLLKPDKAEKLNLSAVRISEAIAAIDEAKVPMDLENLVILTMALIDVKPENYKEAYLNTINYIIKLKKDWRTMWEEHLKEKSST